MKIERILQYRGNNNYFCCLCQSEDDKNFVIFARTRDIEFESKIEEYRLLNRREHQIIIPLYKSYYIMNVDDYKDYELINKILEVVWMDND